MLAALVVVLAATSVAVAARKSTYNEVQVIHAFKKVGSPLYDTTCGVGVVGCSQSGTVVILATLKPHQGWTAAVYIYAKPTQAAQAYNASVKQWHAGGIAARQLANLVVVVVPKGHSITKKAPAFPMPQLVSHALTLVAS
jgi:hypothetical protein